MTGGRRQSEISRVPLERRIESAPDYVVRSANAAFERMIGLSREVIQGRPLSQLAALAMRAEEISAALASGTSLSTGRSTGLFPGAGPGGVTLSHDGGDRSTVMIDAGAPGESVTWQRLADAGLEARDAVARMIGFGELAISDAAAPASSGRASGLAREATEAGSAAIEVIEAISQASRLKAGRVALAEALVDPRALVMAVLRSETARAEEAGVALTLDPGDSISGLEGPGFKGPALKADERQLRDALRHLVRYAVATTPRGSRATVTIDASDGLSIDLVIPAAPEPTDALPAATRPSIMLALPLAQGLLALQQGGLETEDRAADGTRRLRMRLPAERLVSLGER